MTKPITLLLFVALAPSWTQAQEGEGPGCEVRDYDGVLFEDVQAQARLVSAALCEAFELRLKTGKADTARLTEVLDSFLAGSQQALDDRGLDAAAPYAAEFAKASRRLALIDIDDPDLPDFMVTPSLESENFAGTFQSQYEGYSPFEITDAEFCAELDESEPSCTDAFRDFGDAFNNYRSAYDNLFGTNADLLDELNADWDRFLEASKAQTAVEAVATTWWHRGHFDEDHLVGPPPSQIILLHPDLVYHQIDSDTEGSTAELGMGVEWVGINWWNLKVPFGVSLASVYVDHDGAKDVGHGIQLHFDNRYSLGWARHGDKDAFYFNIDVLKFLETREGKFSQYLEKFF